MEQVSKEPGGDQEIEVRSLDKSLHDSFVELVDNEPNTNLETQNESKLKTQPKNEGELINNKLQETKKEDDKEKEDDAEETENNAKEKANNAEEKENNAEEKTTNTEERENTTEETEDNTEEKANNAEEKESEVPSDLEENHNQSTQITFTGPTIRNHHSPQTSLGPIPQSPTPSFESIGDDEREMDHVIMKENRWADLYPNEVKNQFIKQVIETMVITNGRYPSLKMKLEKKLRESTSLSVFKFDEAFVELLLTELSVRNNPAGNNTESFQRLIQDFFSNFQSTDSDQICLDFKKFVNSCLLFLVENNHCKPLCLKRFLDWYFFKLGHKFEIIRKEWDLWKKELEKPFDDKVKVYINEALLEACKRGKHKMVFEFLNKGFQIYDKDFKSCTTGIGKEEHMERLQKNQFNQRHLTMFRAASTPTYLLANFCYRYKKYKKEQNQNPSALKDIDGEDVFSLTLHNIKIAMNLDVDEYDLAEYDKHLRNIINEGREFLRDLVSQCENLEEAKLLLSHDSQLDHYGLKHESTDWDYGRLDEACLSNHTDLVTHDFSQRIFRETWCNLENIKRPLTWVKNERVELIPKILYSIILSPLHVLFYMFAYMPIKNFGSLESAKARLENYHPLIQDLFLHYSVPRNRCISEIACHLVLICLILLTMINPNDEPKVLDIDWYDVCLLVWAFGCFMKYLRDAFYFLKDFCSYGQRSKITHWKRSIQGIRDCYKVMQFLCCAFILVGKLFKFIGFTRCAEHLPKNQNRISRFLSFIIFECELTEQDDPLFYCDTSYVKTGYSLIGIGATICILNLLHWFELCSKMGPIIMSLRHTVSDILKILTTFLVFLVAFSVGLHFSLRLSNVYCNGEYDKVLARTANENQDCAQDIIKTKLEGFSLEDNVNHFRYFRESIKTCFWSFFDPGHPEVIGCTQGPPRLLGMILWAAYQIGNVVIIMNLLIALMNATIAGIQEDKVTHWRFARTQIWKKYFDHPHNCCLPVPFNLLEMVTNLVIMIIKTCVNKKEEDVSEIELESPAERHNSKEEDYLDLVSELCDRYILKKKKMESLSTCCQSTSYKNKY